MVGVGKYFACFSYCFSRSRNVSKINVNKIALTEREKELASKYVTRWRNNVARNETKELAHQSRTVFLNLKERLASITKESQKNKCRIIINDIFHEDKRIAGLNEAEELVAKQHKTSLHPEDAAAVTKKLKICAAADKPVEEAFKNVIFKDIRSYEEFLKTLPVDKRTALATQRIGKLPFEDKFPDFKDKIAKVMDADTNIKNSSLKLGSEDITFHFIGSGSLGNVYLFKVGNKKYVLKVFKKDNDCWMNNELEGRGLDQLHGYLAEANRLFYIQAKHPDLAKHFAHLHYADLGGKNKFAISEYVEKAGVGQGNLNQIFAKLESFGFECSDAGSSNVHGSTIIDAGGIYINSDSKYPSVDYFINKPIFIDKSISGEARIVNTMCNRNDFSRNIPLVVSMPRQKSSRVSKLADPQHPLHQQYLRYAGQAYTKPAHISVFVPQTPPASE